MRLPDGGTPGAGVGGGDDDARWEADVGRFLPGRTELRALYRRYVHAGRERSAGSPGRPRSPADEWMAHVEAPFESVADVSERLGAVEAAFRAAGDRRSVFLTVYTAMTGAVDDGLDGQFFADPGWVSRLLVTFANHYRRALVADERGERDRVPRPWRIAFDAALAGSTTVLQDALLGVNAHINYDLTYALAAVGIDPARGEKFADYERINDVLARLVDGVQVALASVYDAALVADLDRLLGRLDESLADLGLAGSRQFAWTNAVALADVDWPLFDRYVDWRATSVATGAAAVIRSPPLDGARLRRLATTERRAASLAEFQTAYRQAVPAGDPGTWDGPRG